MTEWARTVCRAATQRLDVDGAAISVRASGQVQDLVAATDQWAEHLEELQYTMGEGPGVEAFALGTAVHVADLGAALPRWPGFTDGAAAMGAGAVFAFPLGRGTALMGTLDLYRHRPGPLPTAKVKLAELLADVASTALVVRDGAPDEDHYADVSLATGMVAAQLNVPVDEALLRLQARAFTTDRSVVEVAKDIVARRLRLESDT